MARFLYPLSSISLSGSIFMTVSITVERYWAVCRPTVCRHVFSNVSAVQSSGYYNVAEQLLQIIQTIKNNQ